MSDHFFYMCDGLFVIRIPIILVNVSGWERTLNSTSGGGTNLTSLPSGDQQWWSVLKYFSRKESLKVRPTSFEGIPQRKDKIYFCLIEPCFFVSFLSSQIYKLPHSSNSTIKVTQQARSVFTSSEINNHTNSVNWFSSRH